MFSNRQEIRERLKVSETDFNVFLLGFILYLYLSFMRSFIYLSVIFIVEILPQEIGLILALIPITGLFYPNRESSFPIRVFLVSQLIWFLVFIFPIVIIQYFLLTLGLFFISFMLKSVFRLENQGDIPFAVLIMIVIDQSIRGFNGGIEPIVDPSINFFTLALVASLLIFALANFNVDFHIMEKRRETTKLGPKQNIGGIVSIFGLMLNLLIYFYFFSGAGTLNYALGLTGGFVVSIFMITIGLIALIVTVLWKEIEESKGIIVPITSLLLVLSIFTMPWQGGVLPLFWILGIEAMIVGIIINLESINWVSMGKAAMIAPLALGLIFNNGFIFLMLTNDAQIIRVFLALTAGTFTTIGFFLRGEKS